jgi:beta-galactosidase
VSLLSNPSDLVCSQSLLSRPVVDGSPPHPLEAAERTNTETRRHRAPKGNRKRIPCVFRTFSSSSLCLCASVLKSCLLLALAALCAPAAEPAGSSAPFPAAVWYGGGKARAPMLEPLDATSAARWGNDLDSIKSVGFNTVKCWVDWATAEPKPGEFRFDNLDLLMRLAQERSLRAIVQIYTDSAPDWVGQRFPDGRFVDRSGAVIDSQAAPGFCIDHDGVRAELVRFIEALSREANKFPALYGWDVWSEPHVINWADFPYLANPEFCFCPHTQARFRQWLRTKYQTLAALNTAWYRGFATWDEVQPPRFPTILSYTDYLDWRAFIDDKLAGDLKTRVDAVRSADQTHPITSHAAAPALFTSPMDGYGEPDDWKMASSADFFGTSLYPMHSESSKPWSYPMLAAALDFERSAGLSSGKGFWIGELQAGQGTTGMRIPEPVTAHDVEYWMWESVAHGAKEIAVYAWYPMSSGFESNGYGLINLDGSLTDRARGAGRVAQIINQNASDFLETKPAPAPVAIFYDRLSYMVGGTQASLSKLGNAERDSLMGLHRAFLERHIPVDFVNSADIAGDKVSQYRILFLPYAVMLSKSAAAGIKRYIENGGTAVAEARLAWNDERGFASDVIPGFGLSQVFGAREKRILPVDQPQIFLQWPSADFRGVVGNAQATGAAFEEDLEPSPGAQVLGRFSNGEAAVVENSFGRGKAIYVGSFLGLSYERNPSDPRQLLYFLAQAAGVSPEVEVSGNDPNQVEVRRLVSDAGEILLIFNHAESTMGAGISVRLPWSPSEATNLENGEKIPLQQTEKGISLQQALAGGQILLLRLDRPPGGTGSRRWGVQ